MAAPLTTYPGTVTPLRGLAPYVESERDVFFGRTEERDAVTRLVTQDGVRAGLLYGEPGVGKTSLLRAGVAPHLRDHGVVALLSDDPLSPTDGYARALATATGTGLKPGEKPIDYLTRGVSQGLAGQLYVFVLDDPDTILRHDPDGRYAHEVADLFSRVSTRAAGRARFLFAVADSRVHLLGELEKRTGSLFPPAARFRINRFSREQALDVIDRTLALAGLGADPNLPRLIADGLAERGPILPADIQIAARALADLKIDTAAGLLSSGGARDLAARWLRAAASDGVHGKEGLRVLGALAFADEPTPVTPAQAAAAADVPEQVAGVALESLVRRGVAQQVTTEQGMGAVLSHEILVSRVRELTAGARESAASTRAMLASAALSGIKLSPLERERIADERIRPENPREQAVLTAEKRGKTLGIVLAVAVPLVVLLLAFLMLSGQWYLALEGHGSARRVVAKGGRPALSMFFWLPGPFGEVVGDSGFAATSVDAAAWKQAAGHDVGGSGDAYVERATAGLAAPLRHLVSYAQASDPEGDKHLDELDKLLTSPAARIEALRLLAPIARGGQREAELVATSLADPSPAVQRAGLRVALASAARRPGTYENLLGRTLAAADGDLRGVALAGVHGLPSDTEARLLAAGLAAQPGAAARRDLLAAFAALPQVGPAASADVAVTLLAGAPADVDAATADEAWRMLNSAFDKDAAAASKAAGKLLADSSASEDHRARALALIAERAPAESLGELAADVKAAAESSSAKLLTAALPVYARIAPDEAARKLVSFENPLPPVRVALAAAWGEMARQKRVDVAQPSLETLLDDPTPAVRAAAARAYGRVGKNAQAKLLTLAKNEGGDVAEGAAWGLAYSVEAGGSAADAVSGIGQLWKKKGGPKREAARIYAYLCKQKVGPALTYCASAARDTDDPALPPLGVDGLCAAAAAGAVKAALGPLRAAAEGDSAAAKARVAACLSEVPDLGEAGGATAAKIDAAFAADADPVLRRGAARSLSGLAAGAKPPKGIATILEKLIADTDRGVRLAAAPGLRALGSNEKLGEALAVAWGRADETEKLALVGVASAAGAGEIMAQAARDASPAVRARAVAGAAGAGKALPAILAAALADREPAVRSAALALVTDPKSGLDPSAAAATLELAITGDDDDAAEAALTALAGLDEPARVVTRLTQVLASPSDAVRARAARAASALAARGGAAALLEPLLVDPAHDVRVAAVRALAAEWAASVPAAELGKRLAASETNALRRHVALAALILQAQADKAEAKTELSRLATVGPPFARLYAKLGSALLGAQADALAFLAELVP